MRHSNPPASPAFGSRSPRASKPSATLESRFGAVAGIWAIVVLTATAPLAWMWNLPGALRWMVGASLLAAGILGYAWRHRDENRRDARSPRLEVLGPGNAITLTRGLALAMAGGFLVAPEPEGAVRWAPPILYTGAIVADLLDGVVARRANFSTLLGVRLDIEIDGIGVLLAVLLAVHLGQLPVWFVPVGLARPLFAFGLSWRRRHGLATHELPLSRHRKLLAGIQMGFLSAALWPVLGRDALVVIGVCVLLPFVVGFARDWLVVSGRVDRTDANYVRLHRRAGQLLTRMLPLTLRVLTPVWTIAWLWLREPAAAPLGLSWVALVGGMAIFLGIAGRLGAVAVILAVAISGADGLSPAGWLVLAGAAAILIFGTGPLSLWKPEERYVLEKVDVDA